MGLIFNPLIFSGFDKTGSNGGGSSPSIGGPVTGSTDGSVLFIHPSGSLDQDPSNFNYNATTHALAIAGTISASNLSGSSSGTNTGDVTLGTTSGLSLINQVLSLGLASSGITGALSGSDWTSFNNKQPAGSYVTVSEVGAANGVASLDSGGKVPVSQLPSSVMQYLGVWDASTNTPTLADGTGVNGDVYRVSVAGTVNFGHGNISFNVGDFVIYNGTLTLWQNSPAADGVTSVNGQMGAVTVNAINQLTGDITAGPASGSSSQASTIAKIQGVTVSGTTGSGNIVFSASPTFTGTLNASSGVFSSTISASNFTGSSSGTNTGDQTITLTGDVTGSGTSSFATTLTNSSVTGQILIGFVSGPNSSILSTDSILQGLEKLQAQISSGSSSGDINQTSFTAADNQSSPADVTGFLFANGSVRSFDALVSIFRNNTYAVYKMQGIQKASSWELSQDFTGDSTGLTFSITNVGQIQYTSSSTGFTGIVKFRAIVTSV